MKEYNLKEYQKKLRHELDDNRYQHTLGVMYTCAALAMRYEYDIQRAEAAGLLHDCAKCIPNGKKLKMCEKNHIEVTEIERRNPFLLHSKLGAYVARSEYGVNDDEILSAIESHTTGKPAMTMLEKIVFVADYIEPRRNKAEHLREIRSMAFIDIDRSIYMILSDTLAYLKTGEGEIDSMTERAFNYYRDLTDGCHAPAAKEDVYD